MENSSENSVETTIPGRNGGRLRAGGKPGNKGGTGRPPEALRRRSRRLFDKWLVWAAQQASADKPDPALMMQIGNTAGKFGLGTTVTPTDTDGQTLRAISITHRVVDAPSGN